MPATGPIRIKPSVKRKRLIEHKGGKCSSCGYSDCDAALEFHHPRAKTLELGRAQMNLPYEVLKAEADRCILLCRACHRKEHHGVDYHGSGSTIKGKRIREELIAVMGGKCFSCDKAFPPYAFDFHHLNPKEKSFAISAQACQRHPRYVIAHEAEKCALLCANCHAKAHSVGLGDNIARKPDLEAFSPAILRHHAIRRPYGGHFGPFAHRKG